MCSRIDVSRFVILIAVVAFVGYKSTRAVFSQAQIGIAAAEPKGGQQDAQPKEQGFQQLQLAEPVKRTIGGGQAHSYKILASAGDYLNVAVEQQAVDVMVTLFAPNGRKVLQVDSPNGAFGPEPLMTIVDAAGEYRLEIKTFESTANAGAYELRVKELRAANDEDRRRVSLVAEAQQALDRGVQLVNRGPDSARTAIPAFESALGLWRQLKERYWEALSLSNLAQVYDALDEDEKAFDYYNQALPIQKAVGDQRAAAATLDALGEIYLQNGDKQKSLDYFNQALPLRKATNDVRGEGLTLLGLGRVYLSLGETQKALEAFNQGVPLFKAVGDRSGEAVAIANIAKVYFRIGDLQKALDSYNQALPVFVAVGNRSAEATAKIDIGNVYYEQGSTEKALDLFMQALSYFRGVHDGRREATTLNNLGVVYDRMGEWEKALDFYTEALKTHRASGNQAGAANTLSSIGTLFYSLGESQKALEIYGQALSLHRSITDPEGEANTLHNIGGVYSGLGEKDQALDFFNRALIIRRTINDKMGQAGTLDSIGAVYADSHEQRKALEFINQALGLYQAAGNSTGEAETLANLGVIYKDLGDTQKALDLYNRALALRRAATDRSGEASTLSNLGTLYSDGGDHPKALEFYSRALAIRSVIGDEAGAAETLLNMMLSWSERNPSVGIFFGKHAINLLQQLRANVSGLDREHQKTFLKSKERTYRILAYMLIGSDRLREAHQVLNLFKDEQFFDFNSITDREVSRVALTPGELLINSKFETSIQRMEAIGQQLDQLRLKVAEQKPGSDTTAERQQLETRLKNASDDFVALVKETETDFSRMRPEENKVGEIADTRDLQRTLSDLSKQTGQKAVAVYTLLDKELEGEGNGSFCALVVSADSITVTAQPVKADAVNKRALQLWALLQSDQYDPRPLAQELYSFVFKPIEAAIPKDTGTILWSLDGNLRYLPMGVLYDGKQYLVERYNHVVFTRPDRERLTRAVSPRWNGVGLGSSEAHTVEVLGDKINFNALPGVLEELRALFRQKDSPDGVLDGEILPDVKFTKAAMLSALKQKRPVVHISSHFSFRPGDEARSFLLLGDGTAMTLAEMKQQKDLFSGVELLTLSACNTAAQQAGANGREIDGFAELAQRLGAGSVMATLWPVADNSTPWFMREFYKTRESGSGLTKAEAFRRAQLALLNGTAETKPLPASQKGAGSFVQIVIGGKDGGDGSRSDNASTRAGVVYVSEKDAPLFQRDDKRPFAHPYYWAPFILIGNWK